MKKKINSIILSILLVLLFSIQIKGTNWWELEDQYSTSFFDIYYTDDCDTYPNDCIDLATIQELGDLLELVRQGELGYGFDETVQDYRVFVYDINALGAYSGIVSSWNEALGEWEEFQMLKFDTNFLKTYAESTIRRVAVHEFFHSIQGVYEHYNRWYDARKWIIEGQAEMVMDKIFTEDDQESSTGYFWNCYNFLKFYFDECLMDLYYGAALFWTYVTEQYGALRTEPGLGLDALLQFWEAVQTLGTPSNEFEVFNLMLSNLGYSSLTFEDVFKDFVIANFAKDLTGPNVPSKYKYIDETQPPYSYGTLDFTRDTYPREGCTVAGTDFVNPWSSKYYRYKRTAQTSDVMEVIVNQITEDELFFVLLVIRNDDIIEEIRSTGTHFERTFTGLDPDDEIVLIVSGLDNSPSNPAKYRYSISPGGSFDIDILSPPNWINPAYVGPIDDPDKFLTIVEVIENAAPVVGLSFNDFYVEVGTKQAEVISSAYVSGLYFLEVQAPVQDTYRSYGEDLDVEVLGERTWTTLGVMYSDVGDLGPISDSVIVIDKSGSMYYSDKIDSAQAAARLYVNSQRDDNNLALVQFNESSNLLHGLEEVSTSRNAILNLIDTIQAQGWTSIGNGLHVAQDELYLNGIIEHFPHIILLTDGRENRELWIEDVDGWIYDNGTRLDVVLIGHDAQVQDLQAVARYSGGKAFFAFDPSSGTLTSDLANIYRFIAEDISNMQRVLSKSRSRTGSGTIVEQVHIDNVENTSIVFNYRAVNSLSTTTPILNIPGSGGMAPTFFREKQSVSSSDYYGHFLWDVDNPPVGNYLLNISVSGEIEYLFEVGVSSNITLTSHVGKPFESQTFGEEIPIIASLSDEDVITGATIYANITCGTDYNNYQTWQLHLYDDGAHGDGLSDDGVYGNYFTRTGKLGSIGNLTDVAFSVYVYADGVSNTGGTFSREVIDMFHLVEVPLGDKDGDYLPDVWESRHGLNPSTDSGSDGWDGDPDLDGLKNYEELFYGTSPKNSDTDRGGESDFSEIQKGRDPYLREDDFIKPPLLHAIPGNKNVTLFFGPRSTHSMLSLYRSTDANANFILIASGIDASTSNYTDDLLTNDIKYYYKLVANRSTGEISGFSTFISAIPQIDTIKPYGRVVINDGDECTASREVTLKLEASPDVLKVRISNSPTFENIEWVDYSNQISWTLSGDDSQNVFVQFKDANGNIGGELVCGANNLPYDFAVDGIIVDINCRKRVIIPIWVFILIFGGPAGIIILVLIIKFIIIPRRKLKQFPSD